MKNLVVLMETEDGIISRPNKEYNEEDYGCHDVVIMQSEINELADTEIDESCHDDSIDDYSSELEFCLSNVEKDSYIDYVIDRLDDTKISPQLAKEIQELVIEEITNRFN